jgi:hypothetical protein
MRDIVSEWYETDQQNKENNFQLEIFFCVCGGGGGSNHPILKLLIQSNYYFLQCLDDLMIRMIDTDFRQPSINKF